MSKTDIDFKAIFESLTGLYLILDRDLRIIAVNDSYLQVPWWPKRKLWER